MILAEAVQVPPWVGILIIAYLVAILAVVAASCATASFIVAAGTLWLRGTDGRPARVLPWLVAAAVIGAGCVFAFFPFGLAAPPTIGAVWGLTDNGVTRRRRR